MAEAPDPTHTEDDRLIWLNRYIRFGTILREKAGAGPLLVNLTQGRDIQSQALENIAEARYFADQGNVLTYAGAPHGIPTPIATALLDVLQS
ncbi:hypothetical protein GCM10007164_28080 [Luteimonas padinae]|nr:hypothetical protein GCM10007164_28080 [Luteimonas padinae]